jgi:hypothetical protein
LLDNYAIPLGSWVTIGICLWTHRQQILEEARRVGQFKDDRELFEGVNYMSPELPKDHMIELSQMGINIWVFITPVLPGISDVETVINALPASMPVFLDKLRLDSGSVPERRFFEYLKTYYPELESRYRTLGREDTDPYYEELEEMYQDESRVKFVLVRPKAVAGSHRQSPQVPIQPA